MNNQSQRPDPWNDPHGYDVAKRHAMEHPLAISQRSTVTVVDEDFYAQDYIVTTVRVPGESAGVHVSFVEWVDRYGTGQRTMLPGKVVAAMQRHIITTNKKRRSEAGKENMARRQEQRSGMLGVSESAETETERHRDHVDEYARDCSICLKEYAADQKFD